MVNLRRRPISVWVAQVLLGIYGFGVSSIIVWGLYKGLIDGISNPDLYLMTMIGSLSLVTIFIGGVWGMAIRRSWGRWLGVAGLVVLLIGAAVTQTSRLMSNEDSSFVSVSFVFSLLVVLGLAFLVYSIAAGDAADAFFDRESANAPEHQVSDG